MSSGRRRTRGQLLRVLTNPVEYGVIPELRILRFQDPMSLIGELDKLRRNLLLLKGSKELLSLADRDTVINFAVRNERWGFEVLREHTARILLVHLGVFLREALKFLLHDPELFGRSRFTPQIVNARMRDESFKSVRMPEHPVDHVTAIGCTR